MDKTPTQTGNLGYFFPQPEPLKKPSIDQLNSIKFRGSRTDLQVYHLAYGTKKLRACTYRRMMKRQKRINQKKSKLLLVRSPQEKMLKAQKQAWLRDIQETVTKENLKITAPKIIRKTKGKGLGKKKRKQKRAIKKKIQAAKSTQMKD